VIQTRGLVIASYYANMLLLYSVASWPLEHLYQHSVIEVNSKLAGAVILENKKAMLSQGNRAIPL